MQYTMCWLELNSPMAKFDLHRNLQSNADVKYMNVYILDCILTYRCVYLTTSIFTISVGLGPALSFQTTNFLWGRTHTRLHILLTRLACYDRMTNTKPIYGFNNECLQSHTTTANSWILYSSKDMKWDNDTVETTEGNVWWLMTIYD